MFRNLVFSIFSVLGLTGAGFAATIDLASRGLVLNGASIAASNSLQILDVAPLDLGGGPIPGTGFFQALDVSSSPAIELNTSDGLVFNLSVAPGFIAVSTETERDGDTQLELLFDNDYFARFNLTTGDSLNNILTGSSFSVASLSIWEVKPIPLPGGLPLLLAGLGAFLTLRQRRSNMRAVS